MHFAAMKLTFRLNYIKSLSLNVVTLNNSKYKLILYTVTNKKICTTHFITIFTMQ